MMQIEDELKIEDEEESNSISAIREWAKEAVDVAGGTLYCVTDGIVSGCESAGDCALKVVADVGGIINEDFEKSVEKLIAVDFSGEVMKPLESLKHDFSGTAEERILENTASNLGAVIAGVAIAGPIGAVAGVVTKDIGEKLETYYSENDVSSPSSTDYKLENGTTVSVVANNENDAVNKFSSFGDFYVSNLKENLENSVADAAEVGLKVGETAVDAIGHVVEGTVMCGEGIFNDAVALTGLVGGVFNSSFREECSKIIQVNFAENTIGKLVDSITEDSYLNNSAAGQFAEQCCTAIGQILPMIGIGIATMGTVTSVAGISGELSKEAIKTLATKVSNKVVLATIGASVAGNTMASTLADGVKYSKAFIYSAATGAAEAAIESIGGLFGSDKLVEFVAKATKTTFIPILVVAVEEGAEEVISSIVTPILDKTILNHDENLKEVYTSKEFIDSAINQGLVGFGTSLLTCGLVSKISTFSNHVLGDDVVQIDSKFLGDEAKIKDECSKYIETHPNLSEEAKASLENGNYFPDANGKFSNFYEGNNKSAGYSFEYYVLFKLRSEGINAELQFNYPLEQGKTVSINGKDFTLNSNRRFDLAVYDENGTLTDVYELKVGHINGTNSFGSQLSGTVEFMKNNPNVNVHYLLAENALNGEILTNSSELMELLSSVKNEYGSQFDVSNFDGNEVILPKIKVREEVKVPNFDSYVSVDTEFSGKDLIQIGAVKVEDGKPVEVFNQLINPGKKISPIVEKITGITDEMVKGKPSAAEVVSDFALFTGDLPLIGQNIKSADLPKIDLNSSEIIGTKYFDTLRYVRENGIKPEGRQSLTALADFYNINYPNKHNALSDAQVTAEVYEAIKESYINNK